MKFKIQKLVPSFSRDSKLKVFVLLFLFGTQNAFAGIFTESLGGAPGSALEFNNVLAIFRGLSCWFIRLGIIATGVMMVVYGILFLVSKGNPTSMVNARKALGWGIVGGLVIFGVFTIILTIPELLEIGSADEVDYPIMKILKSCL